MIQSKTILVTGGSGMVGQSLKKIIPNAFYLSSNDCDLTDYNQTFSTWNKYKPDIVIHLAAKVGGIIDNITYPVNYFEENILMNTNVLKVSKHFEVKRLVSILSTCIYPDMVENYPMEENMLHEGPPTKTNFSYGYAKRSLAVHIEAYNQQYGTQYQYLTPCNLYGEFDKYGDNSHFIAALIKKIHLAKINNEDKIILFGDGTPLRQFLHSDDLAFIIKYCLENNIYDNMNVSTLDNLSIKDMAKIALKACDAEYLNIEYDISKPNGQYRKDVSIELLKSKIPSFNPLPLYEGIKKTYQYLIKHDII